MDESAYWDAAAATFDDEPDHGLRDPEVRAAWLALLRSALPVPPARVADLGCGTGSLSALLADEGHEVDGVDLSAAMVGLARAKAPSARFAVGDASAPALPEATYDVVLARHVVWALPDPAAALGRWVRLLRPSGRLVLVEGRWHTGGGLSAAELEGLVRGHREHVEIHPLDDPALWGGPITDERYLLVSRS